MVSWRWMEQKEVLDTWHLIDLALLTLLTDPHLPQEDHPLEAHSLKLEPQPPEGWMPWKEQSGVYRKTWEGT